MNTTITILLAAAALAFLFFRGRGNVSSEEAHRLVEQGARLLDVRTTSEFASGHIPGAINIPVQELGTRTGELGAKDRATVVYCRSGMRSNQAAGILQSAGFAPVHDLGAMSRW